MKASHGGEQREAQSAEAPEGVALWNPEPDSPSFRLDISTTTSLEAGERIDYPHLQPRPDAV